MKPKSDTIEDNRIPGFDTWPPPSKPKDDKKKENLPRNSSYREEKTHDEGDMAVYDVEETETEIDKDEKEKSKEDSKHDK